MLHPRIVFLILATTLPQIVLAADDDQVISPFPGSRLVGQSVDTEVVDYQIITGPVERVATEFLPESSVYVRGVKSVRTFEILNERRTRVVGDYFKEQIVPRGEILFECEGRSCGSSNYWANSLFKRAILYGPEQFQHYFLAKLETDRFHYVIIYVAQRATGKLYSHIETIAVPAVRIVVDAEFVKSALQQQGKYIVEGEVDDALLEAIVTAVDSSDFHQLALVAHDKLQKGDTIDSAIERTRGVAEGLKSRLLETGMVSSMISTHGAGPIAPLNSEMTARIELVVVSD